MREISHHFLECVREEEIKCVACWQEETKDIVELVAVDVFLNDPHYANYQYCIPLDKEVEMFEKGQRIYSRNSFRI